MTDDLDAPDGARLIISDGSITLITIQHVSATRTIVDRVSLGPTTVDAVLAALGLQDHAPAAPRPTQTAPAAAAPPAETAPATPRTTKPPVPVVLDLSPRSSPLSAPARHPSPVPDGVCETCHEPLISHDECDVCTTLIGPGHATEQPVFVSGLDLCHDCAREQVMRRRAELRKEAAA